RRALLVAVEEVIDGRVVLVDALLDHPQAQHADVELDVPGRVRGDRRDVVDALELHHRPPRVWPCGRVAEHSARPARRRPPGHAATRTALAHRRPSLLLAMIAR